LKFTILLKIHSVGFGIKMAKNYDYKLFNVKYLINTSSVGFR